MPTTIAPSVSPIPEATQAPGSTEAAPPTEAAEPTTAAPSGPTVTSTELNLYAWSEYVPHAMLEQFAQEYNVHVNYDTYSSNEELLAKLQAGASNYDVIIPSDYTVDALIKQGLLDTIDVSQLPNFQNIADQFKNPAFDPGNKYTVPYQWGTTAIAVNTDKVKTPITKYADLWSSDFENNLVLLDDEREVIGMALVTLGYDKNSTNPGQLELAKQKLIELKPNIKLFDSDSPKTALLSGEATAGLVWNGEAALASRENPAIKYILPEEGAGLWYDNLAIPKDPPHKDAALAFLNFVMRPDMSVLISKEFPYSNPNQAALEYMKQNDPEVYQVYINSPATNPPPEAIEKGHTVIDVGDATRLYDKLWTEFKGE